MPTSVCQLCGKDVPDGTTHCSECEATARSNTPSAFRFSTGEIIDGRYEVVNRIPGGGMGELYKVRHLHLHDIRAIKILRKNQLSDDTYVKRFLREAQIAASIKHPNVALHHDFAQLPDNSWYMVEEFIEGTTLAKSLRSGRRFSLDEIVEIARQVLLGLGAIHDRGIIHRDISPDNIMLASSRGGAIRVKIIDLGIARSVDTSEAHSLTSAGLFVGKPHYASPEQMRLIEDDAPLDHRTDLYSLGVVLYEVVSGKVPFEASTPFAYLLKQLSGEVPKVDRTVSDMVPPVLENFIVTLLRAKREDRFQSTIEALRALSKIRVGKPTFQQDVEVPAGDAPFPISRPSKKRKQTAEIPIEQLQKLMEEDRPDDVRHPVSDWRTSEPPEEPATQVDNFDDSQKITMIQETPALPTQEVPRPATPETPTDEKPQPESSVEDDAGPVAFVPDNLPEPPPEPPAVASSTSLPAEASPVPPPDNAPQSFSSRKRDNPLVWFAAGIVFVAVVSAGGYLFYRWLETRFGSGADPAPIAEQAKPADAVIATPEVPDENEAPPVEELAEGQVEDPAPADDPAPPPRSTPAPREVEPPAPKPIRQPASPERNATPPPSPVVSEAPAEEPPDPVAPADDTGGPEPDENVDEPSKAPAEPAPADAPVVLPGSTDDVREGDLVAPGPGVIGPEVTRTVEPIYPPLSSNQGREGVAMFSVLVGPEGDVEVVKLIISSGSEPLDESAQDAARQTKFKPATKNGVKVRMWKTLRFEFKKTRGF